MGRDRMSEINGHPVTLDEIWPQAAEHLQPALDYAGGTHTLEHVRSAIEDGTAQIWPIGESGTIVSEIVEAPTGKRVCRLWLAGGTLGALLAAEKIVAEWAREHECAVMEIVGRLGWERVLPEYRRAAVVLRRELKETEA